MPDVFFAQYLLSPAPCHSAVRQRERRLGEPISFPILFPAANEKALCLDLATREARLALPFQFSIAEEKATFVNERSRVNLSSIHFECILSVSLNTPSLPKCLPSSVLDLGAVSTALRAHVT